MNYSQVITYYGSAAKAAKAAGVFRTGIYRWRAKIPLEAQIKMELDSKGFLRADLPKAIRNGDKK